MRPGRVTGRRPGCPTATPSLLDALLTPRSVAIVGASSDPLKLSGRPVNYLTRFGYTGRVIPVNPHHSHVQGLPAFPSVSAIDGQIDLAIITVPAAQVAECIRDCAAAGVRVTAIFAAGFAESDPPHADQDELTQMAGASGMRVLGPNCLGVMALPSGLTATFTSALDELDRLRPGPVAVISQSGAIGSYVFSAGQRAGLGFSHFVNTGNEADLTAGEVLESMAGADGTAVFLMYLEGARDGATLIRGLQAARRADQPIAVVKAGTSDSGRRAARWHTGSDTGEDQVFDDVFRQFGATRVASMEDLLDAARVFGNRRRATGDRTVILSISGGGGAVMADFAVAEGLRVDTWDAHWQARAARGLPSYASTRNPLDLTASVIADPDLFAGGIETAIDHPDSDVIVIGLGNADAGAAKIVAAIVDGYQRTQKPMVVAWTGGNGWAPAALTEAGIPVYADPARAVRALGMLVRYSLHRDPAGDVEHLDRVRMPCGRVLIEPSGIQCIPHRDPSFGLLLRIERGDRASGSYRRRFAVPPFGADYADAVLTSLGSPDPGCAERLAQYSVEVAGLESRGRLR
jgi:acetate---CoA ligase (ADP-forming)